MPPCACWVRTGWVQGQQEYPGQGRVHQEGLPGPCTHSGVHPPPAPHRAPAVRQRSEPGLFSRSGPGLFSRSGPGYALPSPFRTRLCSPVTVLDQLLLVFPSLLDQLLLVFPSLLDHAFCHIPLRSLSRTGEIPDLLSRQRVSDRHFLHFMTARCRPGPGFEPD